MIRIRPSFFIDNNHYSTELREASSTLGDSIVVVSRVAENGANFRRAHWDGSRSVDCWCRPSLCHYVHCREPRSFNL